MISNFKHIQFNLLNPYNSITKFAFRLFLTSSIMDNHQCVEENTASDSEDTCSLCDLSFTDDNPKDTLPCPNNPPPEEAEKAEDDSFHFSANPNIPPIRSLLIFGKSVPHNKPSNLQYTKEEEQEENQRRRISLFRSDSFNRPFNSFRRQDDVKTEKFIADYYGRSDSIRLANKSDGSSTATIGSGSFRKYKALIGVPKVPAKMDLNEIRRRQSRLPPAPMFPATGKGVRRKSLWGLLRTLTSRSHVIRALA